MITGGLHSMVIASDCRVPDPDRVCPLLRRRMPGLAGIGAHHVLVYRSTHDDGRVLVLIGVRSRQPVVELLRSRVFFDWFDAIGVDDIPAVFAGEIVERFDSTPARVPTAHGVIVAAVASVDDVAALAAEIRGAIGRFQAAGIRKTWIFQAFDDTHEVLILQDIGDEKGAMRWIEHPDVVAQWMTRVGGIGAYPPLFAGTFMDMVSIEQ
ncbi:MAG: fatty-acid--CoA ligase [Mycobacterium sp.]|uniref:fatty-acid--CoA ligase n=1 Tax=Mycobacterium sp. TaxID=1785 RepID=UPI00261EC032|nr:fatty-acid--CoA ligase [Mycobacterium sp.]MDI3315385.1 fatty-acid--CoA ligase [Mycobacterium sp.]